MPRQPREDTSRQHMQQESAEIERAPRVLSSHSAPTHDRVLIFRLQMYMQQEALQKAAQEVLEERGMFVKRSVNGKQHSRIEVRRMFKAKLEIVRNIQNTLVKDDEVSVARHPEPECPCAMPVRSRMPVSDAGPFVTRQNAFHRCRRSRRGELMLADAFGGLKGASSVRVSWRSSRRGIARTARYAHR
jgi:hypothetical protein